MSDIEMMTEFKFILTRPFSYAFKGEQATAEFITLTAPTSKTIRECSALKQAFFRAMGDREGKDSGGADTEDVTIEGQDILSLLAMSKSVDLPEIMDVAKKLFQLPGIALVDGETKFGQQIMDRMNIDDFENMLGEYMVNFTLASSLKRLKEKSSKASAT